MRVNSSRYISAQQSRKAWKSHWIVRSNAIIDLGQVAVPKELVGKRVAFKLEVLDDETKNMVET